MSDKCVYLKIPTWEKHNRGEDKKRKEVKKEN